MSVLVHILITVLPVFLVIGLGFALKRIGFFTGDFLKQLNKLVFYVSLPALLFYKIASADFKESFNSALLFGLFAGVAATYILSYLYGKMKNYPAPKLGAFCQGAFRGNLAFIGLAVVFYVYGEEGFATAGILIGFLVPFFNLLAVVALLLPQRKVDHSISPAFWIYQVAFNPLILASFAGIIWSILELPLPIILDQTLKIVTGLALPLALLSIGASFSLQRLQGDIIIASLATVIKLVVSPLVTLGILILLGIEGRDLGIALVLAGAPTAAAAYIMAGQLKSDAELSGSIIMLSTLFSLFTYTAGLSVLTYMQQ